MQEQNQPRKHKASLAQKIPTAVGGLCLPFLLAQPTMAGLSGVAETIRPYFSTITGLNIDPYVQYLKETEKLYADINNRNLDGVIRGAKWVLGEMGYPIPNETPQSIENAASQVIKNAGPFNPTFHEVQDALMGDAIYQMQKASAEAELGEQGQQILEEDRKTMAQLVAQGGLDAQTTSRSASTIQTLASRAQSTPISQNILKLMALQNGEIAQQFANISAQSNYNTAVLQGIYNEVQSTRVNSLIQNQGISKLVRNDQHQKWETRLTELGQQVYNVRLSTQGFGYGLPSKSTNNTLFP